MHRRKIWPAPGNRSRAFSFPFFRDRAAVTPGALISLKRILRGAIEACRRSNQFAGARERNRPRPLTSLERQGSCPKRAARESRAALPRFSSKQIVKRKSGMAPTAAYLIALALTLLILVILWEGLS
jgi:hypothetical protein